MSRVLDYSGWRPTPAQWQEMLATDIVGVSRYLGWGDQSAWKRITKPEYDGLLASGLSVVLNFEQYAARAVEGYDAGKFDGSYARSYARQLGHPDERPIIQSCDTFIPNEPGILALCMDYMRGFNDGGGVGPQGIYGGTTVIDEAFRLGLVRVGWQAAAGSWSPHPSTNPAMKQLVVKPYDQFPPAAYDANDVLKADWGQVGGIMAIDPNDVLKIVNGTWDWPIPEGTPAAGSTQKRLINAEANSLAAKTEATNAKIVTTATKAVVDVINTTLGSVVNAVNVGNSNDLARDLQLKQSIADLTALVNALTAKVDAISVGQGATPAEVQSIVHTELGKLGLNLSP